MTMSAMFISYSTVADVLMFCYDQSTRVECPYQQLKPRRPGGKTENVDDKRNLYHAPGPRLQCAQERKKRWNHMQ